VAELFLSVAHRITQTKTISYKCYRVPENVTAEQMATVIELFKEEELERPLDEVEKHTFTYFLETKDQRGSGGGLAWPLEHDD
jgi:hypothetical protein